MPASTKVFILYERGASGQTFQVFSSRKKAEKKRSKKMWPKIWVIRQRTIK